MEFLYCFVFCLNRTVAVPVTGFVLRPGSPTTLAQESLQTRVRSRTRSTTARCLSASMATGSCKCQAM
ncbi:hypothetical protein EMIT0P74_20068 [Pseudomonas sp. IT-P74]